MVTYPRQGGDFGPGTVEVGQEGAHGLGHGFQFGRLDRLTCLEAIQPVGLGLDFGLTLRKRRIRRRQDLLDLVSTVIGRQDGILSLGTGRYGRL